jgi:hypothetical protein
MNNIIGINMDGSGGGVDFSSPFIQENNGTASFNMMGSDASNEIQSILNSAISGFQHGVSASSPFITPTASPLMMSDPAFDHSQAFLNQQPQVFYVQPQQNLPSYISHQHFVQDSPTFSIPKKSAKNRHGLHNRSASYSCFPSSSAVNHSIRFSSPPPHSSNSTLSPSSPFSSPFPTLDADAAQNSMVSPNVSPRSNQKPHPLSIDVSQSLNINDSGVPSTHFSHAYFGNTLERPMSTPIITSNSPSISNSPFSPFPNSAYVPTSMNYYFSAGSPSESPASAGIVNASITKTKTTSLKEFKCPRPYCSKVSILLSFYFSFSKFFFEYQVYKNSNGLRYHLDRGECEYEADADITTSATVPSAIQAVTPSTPTLTTLPTPTASTSPMQSLVLGSNVYPNNESVGLPGDIKITTRPHVCHYPGCAKKYKNLNGLKYHARIVHPDWTLREVRGLKPDGAGGSGEDDDADDEGLREGEGGGIEGFQTFEMGKFEGIV